MFISFAAGGFCPASASPGCTNAARYARQGIHPLCITSPLQPVASLDNVSRWAKVESINL